MILLKNISSFKRGFGIRKIKKNKSNITPSDFDQWGKKFFINVYRYN